MVDKDQTQNPSQTEEEQTTVDQHDSAGGEGLLDNIGESIGDAVAGSDIQLAQTDAPSPLDAFTEDETNNVESEDDEEDGAPDKGEEDSSENNSNPNEQSQDAQPADAADDNVTGAPAQKASIGENGQPQDTNKNVDGENAAVKTTESSNLFQTNSSAQGGATAGQSAAQTGATSGQAQPGVVNQTINPQSTNNVTQQSAQTGSKAIQQNTQDMSADSIVIDEENLEGTFDPFGVDDEKYENFLNAQQPAPAPLGSVENQLGQSANVITGNTVTVTNPGPSNVDIPSGANLVAESYAVVPDEGIYAEDIDLLEGLSSGLFDTGSSLASGSSLAFSAEDSFNEGLSDFTIQSSVIEADGEPYGGLSNSVEDDFYEGSLLYGDLSDNVIFADSSYANMVTMEPEEGRAVLNGAYQEASPDSGVVTVQDAPIEVIGAVDGVFGGVETLSAPIDGVDGVYTEAYTVNDNQNTITSGLAANTWEDPYVDIANVFDDPLASTYLDAVYDTYGYIDPYSDPAFIDSLIAIYGEADPLLIDPNFVIDTGEVITVIIPDTEIVIDEDIPDDVIVVPVAPVDTGDPGGGSEPIGGGGAGSITIDTYEVYHADENFYWDTEDEGDENAGFIYFTPRNTASTFTVGGNSWGDILYIAEYGDQSFELYSSDADIIYGGGLSSFSSDYSLSIQNFRSGQDKLFLSLESFGDVGFKLPSVNNGEVIDYTNEDSLATLAVSYTTDDGQTFTYNTTPTDSFYGTEATLQGFSGVLTLINSMATGDPNGTLASGNGSFIYDEYTGKLYYDSDITDIETMATLSGLGDDLYLIADFDWSAPADALVLTDEDIVFSGTIKYTIDAVDRQDMIDATYAQENVPSDQTNYVIGTSGNDTFTSGNGHTGYYSGGGADVIELGSRADFIYIDSDSISASDSTNITTWDDYTPGVDTILLDSTFFNNANSSGFYTGSVSINQSTITYDFNDANLINLGATILTIDDSVMIESEMQNQSATDYFIYTSYDGVLYYDDDPSNGSVDVNPDTNPDIYAILDIDAFDDGESTISPEDIYLTQLTDNYTDPGA